MNGAVVSDYIDMYIHTTIPRSPCVYRVSYVSRAKKKDKRAKGLGGRRSSSSAMLTNWKECRKRRYVCMCMLGTWLHTSITTILLLNPFVSL